MFCDVSLFWELKCILGIVVGEGCVLFREVLSFQRYTVATGVPTTNIYTHSYTMEPLYL